MNINWKLRLKNKATLTALCVAVITGVYGILAAIGITPSFTQEQVLNLVYTGIAILCGIGVVVDPTTAGLSDSEQAMTYGSPKKGDGGDI